MFVVPALCFAGAAMFALAWPVAQVVQSLGQAGSQGAAPIAHTLAVFGPGLLGYGIAFVMTRILFSLDDVRRAALLVSCSALVGVVAMIVAVAAHRRRTSVLPRWRSATALPKRCRLCLLTARVKQLTGVPAWSSLARLGIGSVAAAGLAAVAMLVIQDQFGTGRWPSVLAMLVATVVGAPVFVAAVGVLAGVRPSMLVRRRVADV